MRRTTRTTRSIDRELMRLLHGELPPAEGAALRQRMASEPELAAAYERLESSWGALDLPPSAGVPLGFARRVMARAARLPRPGSLSWGAAPAWVRAAAAACLIAGAAAGAGLSVRWSERATLESGAPEIFASAESEDTESLAESYWGEVADSSLGEADSGRLEGKGEIGEPDGAGRSEAIGAQDGLGGPSEGSPL